MSHRIVHARHGEASHVHEGPDSTAALALAKACDSYPSYERFIAEYPGDVWAVDAPAAPGVTPVPTPTPAAVPYAMQPRTNVPLPMLDATPDGYFAVRLDDNDPYRFIRIKRPIQRKNVRTKWVGCIHVQSQHSDLLKSILLYAPLGARPGMPDEWLWVLRPDWERHIILALVDPMGAGLAYARELQHCCRCGKALTDIRSRHYGIGPDCEKLWPEHIEYVDGLDEE